MPKPHVVIVGAGFGGLSAAAGLRRVAVDVTVIDRHNHHLFQPLLYQVATAALSPADIAAPIRAILGSQANARTVLGTVAGIDTGRRLVMLDGRHLSYDFLIVATGARESYFGHDEWAAVTLGLKSLQDARTMRQRILMAFEQAEDSDDAAEQRRLLTFVIVGGGPTGVELAGALAELSRAALARDFRRIDPQSARIILMEAGPRLLAGFPERLSAVAARALQRLGVELRLGIPVTDCDGDGVTLGAERIESRTLIWAAGVAASPAAQWLGIDPGRGGRVPVAPDLSLPGHPEILVIGDTAQVEQADGSQLPGIAPVAKQQGWHAARAIAARLSGRTPAPFRYRDYGNLATIGRREAVIDFGWLRLSGRLAWLIWGVAHIYFLIGFRNRLTVAIEWFWSYLTYQRGARLIIGESRTAADREDAMAYDVPPPKERPEPGYYYHFKHDTAGPLNNYAYYIYGVGHHTEDDCRPEDSFMQVYRPLYEAYASRNGGMFDLRPLHMFYEPATRDGKKVPRFTRITDPGVIAQLAAIRARMYPEP